MMSTGAARVLVCLGLVFCIITSASILAQEFAEFREYEPVVLEGRQFAVWVNQASIDSLNIYYYDGNYHPIPFQIDKRRIVHINRNVDPIDPGYALDNCEYSYFPELYLGPKQEPPTEFSQTTLQEADEIVFLLRDSLNGTQRASKSIWLGSGTGTSRYEIVLTDSVTDAKKYLYAYQWNGTAPDRNTSDYLTWNQEESPPVCPPDPRACGTVVSAGMPDLPNHDVTFAGNWITNGYQIKEPGSSTSLPDLLYRFQYTAAPAEDENTWSNGGYPVWLGLIDGPVRVVRAIQGAQSGRRTTKYEFVYPTMFVTQVNLRVHDLDFMTTSVNHDVSVANNSQGSDPGYLWAETYYDSHQEPIDLVDGHCSDPETCVSYAYARQDWAQLSTTAHGSYVDYLEEERAIPVVDENVFPKYQDSKNSNPAVAKYGKYTVRYEYLACTEDGWEDGPEGNESGCSDPEDENLYFARTERIMVPQSRNSNPGLSGSVTADTFVRNQLHPVFVTANKQNKFGSGGPCDPTVPITDGSDNQNGATHFDVQPSGPCQEIRLYRAEGGGEFNFLKSFIGSTLFTDYTAKVGQQYRYRAVSVNEVGEESAPSGILILTPTDTTAPPPPVIQSSYGGDMSASLEAQLPCTRDTLGVNLYISEYPGGPYTKINSAPISPRNSYVSWIQTGLSNGEIYYFVATTVDFYGNESTYSMEVAILVGD